MDTDSERWWTAVPADRGQLVPIHGDHLRFLKSLSESLRAQETLYDEQFVRLEGEILTLQRQLTEAVGVRSRLEQERNLSQEAYEALARKSQESRLAADDQETVARLASRASAPSMEIAPNVVLNMILGR